MSELSSFGLGLDLNLKKSPHLKSSSNRSYQRLLPSDKDRNEREMDLDKSQNERKLSRGSKKKINEIKSSRKRKKKTRILRKRKKIMKKSIKKKRDPVERVLKRDKSSTDSPDTIDGEENELINDHDHRDHGHGSTDSDDDGDDEGNDLPNLPSLSTPTLRVTQSAVVSPVSKRSDESSMGRGVGVV